MKKTVLWMLFSLMFPISVFAQEYTPRSIGNELNKMRGEKQNECVKFYEDFLEKNTSMYLISEIENDINALNRGWEYHTLSLEHQQCVKNEIYIFAEEKAFNKAQGNFDNEKYEKVIASIPEIVNFIGDKKLEEKKEDIIKLLYIEAVSYEKLGKLDISLEKFNGILDKDIDKTMQDKVIFKINSIKEKIEKEELEKKQEQERLEREKKEQERIEAEKKRAEELKREKEELMKASMEAREIAKYELGDKAPIVELVAKKLKQKNDPRIIILIRKAFLPHKREDVRNMGIYILHFLEK